MEFETILQVWPLIIGALGLTSLLAKALAVVNGLNKRVDKLEADHDKQREEDQKRIEKQFDAVNSKLDLIIERAMRG